MFATCSALLMCCSCQHCMFVMHASVLSSDHVRSGVSSYFVCVCGVFTNWCVSRVGGGVCGKAEGSLILLALAACTCQDLSCLSVYVSMFPFPLTVTPPVGSQGSSGVRSRNAALAWIRPGRAVVSMRDAVFCEQRITQTNKVLRSHDAITTLLGLIVYTGMLATAVCELHGPICLCFGL